MVERHLDVRTEAERALKEDSVPAGHSVVFSIRIPVVLRLEGTRFGVELLPIRNPIENGSPSSRVLRRTSSAYPVASAKRWVCCRDRSQERKPTPSRDTLCLARDSVVQRGHRHEA